MTRTKSRPGIGGPGGVGVIGVAAAMVLGIASAAAAGPAVATGARTSLAADTHSGALTATGVCPFDYEFDTSGQSYLSVTTTGTLTGFTSKKTYYVYDNNNHPTAPPPALAVANAKGQLVFEAKNLHLPGPDGAGTSDYAFFDPAFDSGHASETDNLKYYISTDPHAAYDPPDAEVYKPATTLTVNRLCNPWTAEGGTTFRNDPEEAMSNGNYALGATNGATAGSGSGDFALLDNGRVIWSTHTSGSSNRLVMQTDGDLVVYRASTAIWQSGTSGHAGAHLVLQADRNLVIYSTTGKALWQTGTYIRR